MTQLNPGQMVQLAVSRQMAGDLQNAEALYQSVLQAFPDYCDALYGLGLLHLMCTRFDLAVKFISRALAINPNLNLGHKTLGDAYFGAGRMNEAIEAFKVAIRVDKDPAGPMCNLATIYMHQQKLHEAFDILEKAAALNPTLAQIPYNMALLLSGGGHLDEGAHYYRRALECEPKFADAHNNLGNTLRDAGQIDEALKDFRKAISLAPGNAEFHSNLVYSLHFDSQTDSSAILAEARRWAAIHADPLKKNRAPQAPNRDPHRRLRIGYISADFRSHPVGRFMLGAMTHRNRSETEVFCYFNADCPDSMSERIKADADKWVSIFGQSDEAVSQRVQSDQIDILVDLAFHTSSNRLLVFARKPAPIQVTYLGLCSTTGMSAIDYRLSDPFIDPPGIGDELYSEQTVRLPSTYWCYDSGVSGIDPSPLPALQNGYITFGCLNNFGKVSHDAQDAWRVILQSVPNSRLIVHAKMGHHRKSFCDRLGVDPSRVIFSSYVDMPSYYRQYQQIDICLDPFPFNGGTTTCDAIWMGVPVVTLRGRTSVGRVGASVVSNVGHPELIAASVEQYVAVARGLSSDLPKLSTIRQNLRPQMQQSPLMNGPLMARSLEAAYRQMWKQWCSTCRA